MKKRMILGFGVLGALVIVGLFTLVSNLNRIVAAAIEKHGSSATGTSVSVAGVDIQLREGSSGIENLRVGSPEGYKASDAFRLGGIEVDVDVSSVREDPIVIERIEITAPEIFAEFQKDGSSNLSELREHLERFAPKGGGSGGDSDAGPAKRIRIEELVFSEGQIAVDASALGIEARSVQLPSFRLSNVGGADGGTPPELAKEILSSLVGKATSEVGRSEVSRRMREVLGDTGDGAKALLDKIRN
jgi:uncharacterized protein involved in outer membrane biogenesis